MRHIPSAIEAALESGAAKLCHVWLIKRRDGVTLGFSDHDRAFTFLGVETVPQSAFSAGAAEAELGVAASSQSVAGQPVAAPDSMPMHHGVSPSATICS